MAGLTEQSEDAQKKRLAYLKLVYFAGIAIVLIYILRFNFEYGIPDYNTELIVLWLVLALLPPGLMYGYKNYFLTALVTFFLETVLVVYLLFVSGGVDAPGVFWLAVIPLVGAILLNTTGAITGYVMVFFSLIFFGYVKSVSETPQLVLQKINYSFEKLFNVSLFILFAGYTTHRYVQGELRYAKRLVDKNTDIENLLRVLLHDIANTLSSMTYNLLKVKEGTESNERFPPTTELDKIEKSVEDINSLLHQVRHLKSVKDGKAILPLTPLALCEILKEVCESSETMAQRKNIQIVLSETNDKLMILGEKTILSTIILLNLVHNAVKFSRIGGRVELRAVENSEYVIVEIQDFGVGMPQILLDQIFNVNVPTTRSGTLGEKGTGYGMPLVKEYLQMMGGSIEISSHEETTSSNLQGTTVRLSFPRILDQTS